MLIGSVFGMLDEPPPGQFVFPVTSIDGGEIVALGLMSGFIGVIALVCYRRAAVPAMGKCAAACMFIGLSPLPFIILLFLWNDQPPYGAGQDRIDTLCFLSSRQTVETVGAPRAPFHTGLKPRC